MIGGHPSAHPTDTLFPYTTLCRDVDVLTSSFQGAGQRGAALRVLFVQQDVADRMLRMLKGAMAELVVGDPALLSTDVGPVIDEDARRMLEQHKARMAREATRSEEHTSELQSLMRISYAVFCLKKKTTQYYR